MAYITKENAKNIREALKSEFKDIKFSITVKDHMTLNVSIMESPYFEAYEYTQVNHFYIYMHYSGIQEEVLSKINRIIVEVGGYYYNSDIMSDYFDIAFYYNIAIGKWNKGHIVRESK